MVRDPKTGEVLAYHPVLHRPESVPVTIEGEPYELGDGSRIVKARRADGRRVYPSLHALERVAEGGSR